MTKNANNTQQKGTSPFLVKDGAFVKVQLHVRPVNPGEIYADISFTNGSSVPLLYYKTLLPVNGELKTDLFSMFLTDNLDQVAYKGRREGRYLLSAPDDKKGVIIPDPQAEKFITMQPDQILTYTVNLSKFYTLSAIPKGSRVTLAFAEFVPVVDPGFQQAHQKDKIDDKTKPLYYYITLPKKEDLDFMRLQFLMP